MDKWLQFLAQQGAILSESPNVEVLGFGSQAPGECPAAAYVAPLCSLGLISADGQDAADFLHNQLTNDVLHLEQGQARLAGYCTPKGRLLATLLIWRTQEKILLQIPRQIQAAVQKRLQMFVLRAKVKLDDAGGEQVALGLAGTAAGDVLLKFFPSLPSAPFLAVSGDSGVLIRVADAGGEPRYQWIASPETACAAWPELVKTLRPAGERAWRLSEIRAGIPQITQATQEQFVPQMVNYELVGGVNFKKGCYPGQEIVARSQYLGKLKRRMMLAAVDAADATAGNEVFSNTDPDQPCGMVVNAAPESGGHSLCLVELKLAALDDGAVCLRSASGPRLDFRPLPYELRDPE